MADVPVNYLERYFLPAGLIFVFFVSWAVFNIHNYTKLKQFEIEITSKFKILKINEDPVYIPDMEIAGPAGDIIKLSDNNDKYTVMNIWATWCAPCVKELASLRRLSEVLPYDSGWRVIAISIDSEESLPKVAEFTAKYKVEDIANYYDYSGALQKAVNIEKLPMTLLIDNRGRILYEVYGDAFWHDKEIVDFLKLIRKVY